MSDSKVIEFPKEQSWLARRFQRTQERRAAMVFSLAIVFVTSMFLNQLLNRGAAIEAGRGIASFDNVSEVKQIKWEQELAKSVARNNTNQVLVGERPSLRDQLVFGELEGRYGVKVTNGKISALEFLIDNSLANPKIVDDRIAFLEKYKAVLVGDYDHVILSKRDDGGEVYKLLRKDNTIVGEASFAFDSGSSVRSITITL